MISAKLANLAPNPSDERTKTVSAQVVKGHRTTDEMSQEGWQQGNPLVQNPKIVAMVPAYNEERFIGSLVIKLRRYFARVVVIDDGSTDDTVEVAQLAGAIVYSHGKNRGKSESINTAFRIAREIEADALVLLDGDGQHRVEDALAVLRPVLLEEADIVVGSRFLGTKSETPAHRIVGQQVLNLFTSVGSGVPLSDSQSGLRAFSRRAVSLLSFSSQGFSVESEMQFKIAAHHLRVVETPITVLYREPDKRSPFRHGAQVVSGILLLVARQRPLLLFGGAGLVMTLAGLGLGIEVAVTYAHSHNLAIGYGLVTMLLITVGIFSMFCGLMLNSLTGLLQELALKLTLVSQQVLPPLLLGELKNKTAKGTKLNDEPQGRRHRGQLQERRHAVNPAGALVGGCVAGEACGCV